MSRAARHVFVSGRVQGVAFRWYAREEARELDLAGWVRNLTDGSVELWVEGEADSVERFLRWLEGGPSAARVERVNATERDPEGLTSFEIVSLGFRC